MRLNPLLKGFDLPPKTDADFLPIIRSKIVFMRDISSVRPYFHRGGHGKVDDVRAESARAQSRRRHEPPVVAVKISLSIRACQVFSLQAVWKIKPAFFIVSIRRSSPELHKPEAGYQQYDRNRPVFQHDASNFTRRYFSQNNSRKHNEYRYAAHCRINDIDCSHRNPIQTYPRDGLRVDSALGHVSSPRQRFRGRPSAIHKLHSHIITVPPQTQEPPRQNRLPRRWSIL